jgi:hypothetical protein
MKSMAKTKPVLIAAVAALAFSAALAPRLVDGGTFYKGGIANAAEDSGTELNKKKKTDDMTDSDFDNDTDANETN